MASDKRAPSLVLVDWFDAQHQGDGWQAASDVDFQLPRAMSVGFVLAWNDEQIAHTQAIFQDKRDLIGPVEQIPTGMIETVWPLMIGRKPLYRRKR